MWLNKVKERKDGGFTMCAESDEGGGFVEGCQHKHPTPDEAQACVEAAITIGCSIGFPPEDFELARVAYDAYCAYAGWKSLATGADLPQWLHLKVSIQAGWLVAASAVHGRITKRQYDKLERELRQMKGKL